MLYYMKGKVAFTKKQHGAVIESDSHKQKKRELLTYHQHPRK